MQARVFSEKLNLPLLIAKLTQLNNATQKEVSGPFADLQDSFNKLFSRICNTKAYYKNPNPQEMILGALVFGAELLSHPQVNLINEKYCGLLKFHINQQAPTKVAKCAYLEKFLTGIPQIPNELIKDLAIWRGDKEKLKMEVETILNAVKLEPIAHCRAAL